jgi:hypothetical protein
MSMRSSDVSWRKGKLSEAGGTLVACEVPNGLTLACSMSSRANCAKPSIGGGVEANSLQATYAGTKSGRLCSLGPKQ